RTHSEVRLCPGGYVSLRGRAKLCDTAQAWRLRPTRHSLWLTIQSPSPTIYQPHNSAERDDTDQCDGKLQRQQACAPFLSETLTPRAWQNHSNVFQLRNRSPSRVMRQPSYPLPPGKVTPKECSDGDWMLHNP